MSFPLQTTAPAAALTSDARAQVPVLALVIVWCEKEPWRVGEVAFFPPSKPRWIGRGGEAIEEFASFDQHRPGNPIPRPLGIVGCLHGDSLSRRQGKVTASAVDLEIENHGRCAMLVNGQEAKRATVRPGGTIMFVGEVLFVCELRLPDFPALKHATIAHRFGERDAGKMAGEGPEAWRVRDEVARLGKGMDFLLILGETGTGKARRKNSATRQGWSERSEELSKKGGATVRSRGGAPSGSRKHLRMEISQRRRVLCAA